MNVIGVVDLDTGLGIVQMIVTLVTEDQVVEGQDHPDGEGIRFKL